ncbi:hypothetical protein UlMin_024948 [Ulmus minor]
MLHRAVRGQARVRRRPPGLQLSGIDGYEREEARSDRGDDPTTMATPDQLDSLVCLKLSLRADFHCFKYKIEPKWEDPVCANGGKWTMIFQRGKSDTCWVYTKISIWTKNALNEAAQVSIGKQWKEFLDYNESIGFIFHEDAKKLDRGAKNKYIV